MYLRYRQLIPTLILALACLGTLLNVISNGYALNPGHYGGFAATLVLLASFFWFRSSYSYLLLLCFLLALSGVINFLPSEMTIGLYIGELRVGLSIAGILLGLLVYILNHQRVNALLFNLIRPSTEKTAQVHQEAVGEFKERFNRKSPEELTQIVTANRLVPAAIEAARQLLQERRVAFPPTQ